MELHFKPDWAATKQRLAALWENEIIDRCCVSVTAPKDAADAYHPVAPSSPTQLEQWYNNVDWILKRNLERFNKMHFAGDALPSIFPYFGTGGHAKYLSDKAIYMPETIWVEHVIDDYDRFSFDMPVDNPVFQRELSIIKTLAEVGQNRFFMTPPDNCGSVDALAQLRGNAPLLMDFLDDPEHVKMAVKKLVKVLGDTSLPIFDAVRTNNDGGSVHGWMNTWHPGKHLQLQCDMSVMLSAAIFEEFVLPELIDTCEFLDAAIYHLDGIEQLRHLDMLLSVPKIRMIQWTQVAGQPPLTAYFDSLLKIQASGRGLVLIISTNQIDDVLNTLSPKGVNLIVNGARSAQEADDIVNHVAKHKYRAEQLK